ncbi:hypothetical protein Pth03_36490 [Planotetraspora thailandica]|uniref:Uncharacterized protein n=1 Tax=Planotetraspora thailandica TaxID=487172 RepID=A0A8J3VCZ7_9ACTN|nr:hypothetical protein Pth03_36490 [Planotetraspora thailandica]
MMPEILSQRAAGPAFRGKSGDPRELPKSRGSVDAAIWRRRRRLREWISPYDVRSSIELARHERAAHRTRTGISTINVHPRSIRRRTAMLNLERESESAYGCLCHLGYPGACARERNRTSTVTVVQAELHLQLALLAHPSPEGRGSGGYPSR